jgi:hypothetical protein
MQDIRRVGMMQNLNLTQDHGIECSHQERLVLTTVTARARNLCNDLTNVATTNWNVFVIADSGQKHLNIRVLHVDMFIN